jgi:cellulose synthase operon protein C
VLQGPVGEVKLEGPSGKYVRREAQQGNVVKVEEECVLTQSRVPPKQYDAFAQFAGEVDLVQQRDLLFEKR